MPELTLDHIQEFLTGIRRVAEPTRVLSTVLFTDIVGATQRAAELGDRRWREVLNVHDELAGAGVGIPRACTPARSSCATTMSAAWPRISRPA